MNYAVIIIILLCERFFSISCSPGDRSTMYQECVTSCIRRDCLENGREFANNARHKQDVWCRLMGWRCGDECMYNCMWQTVKAYEQTRGVLKFHGKWPFVRLLGVQEPASAFASLLNLASNAYMYTKIRREFPVRTMPLVLFWHGFAFVCMNAWVWSTIFHTRDLPFTEFMDYACALSMVMGLFVTAVVRIFHKKRKLVALVLMFPVSYFTTHVLYLYEGRIDYDYNMLVNVVFGSAGCLLWFAWAWHQHVSGREYAWRMAAFTALSGGALALELLDFPPLWRTWDAHALWHLATAPLPLLFYGYVIHDLRYLQSGQYEKLA